MEERRPRARVDARRDAGAPIEANRAQEADGELSRHGHDTDREKDIDHRRVDERRGHAAMEGRGVALERCGAEEARGDRAVGLNLEPQPKPERIVSATQQTEGVLTTRQTLERGLSSEDFA